MRGLGRCRILRIGDDDRVISRSKFCPGKTQSAVGLPRRDRAIEIPLVRERSRPVVRYCKIDQSAGTCGEVTVIMISVGCLVPDGLPLATQPEARNGWLSVGSLSCEPTCDCNQKDNYARSFHIPLSFGLPLNGQKSGFFQRNEKR